ncbi:hypothetical protein HZC34_04740 [Candidatus Saganbacteria bacterium]|nr:hypothetical protein [Candidatus Saganbacteria bacterium]
MRSKILVGVIVFGILGIVLTGCNKPPEELVGSALDKGTTTTATSTTSTSSTTSTTTTVIVSTTTTTLAKQILLPPDSVSAQATDTYVELTWKDSPNAHVTGYKIYRMSAGSSDFNLLSTQGKVNKYSDHSVESGQTYIYAVRSIGDGSDSDLSIAAVIIFTLVDKIAPAAPVSLSVSSGTTTVSLDWQKNSEADLSGYNIYRKTEDEALFNKINKKPIVSNYFSDTSLASNKTYQYKVTAVDTSSNESGPSVVVTIKTLASVDTSAPAAPANFTATGGEYQVSLKWDSNQESDLNHYNVYRKTKSSDGTTTSNTAILNIASNSYLDADVSNGTVYYYQITAVDLSGNESAKSAEISATPSSTIDDNAVINSQLTAYELGMKNMDITQVMSTISDNYLDWYETSYKYYKSGYQDNLTSTFGQNNITSYKLSATGVTINKKAATVAAKVEMSGAGKKTASYDYTGSNLTYSLDKTFSMAREGDTWKITRDKTDKEAAFMTLPTKAKAGYNIMYQAVILWFDNNNNFYNKLKSVFAQDPSGNPISFSSGYFGLVGYGSVEAGDYSANVVLTDKNDYVYNLTHNYKVSGISSSSISALGIDGKNQDLMMIGWMVNVLGAR